MNNYVIVILFFFNNLIAYSQDASPTAEPSPVSPPDASTAISNTPTTAPSKSTGSEKKLVTEEISLPVGIDKVLQLEFNFSGQMSLGDTSLLRVEPDLRKKRITFIGLKPGTTSVTVRDAVGDEKIRYLITVTSDDLSKTVGELRDLIGDVEGIEIGIRGGKVFVGGQIVVPNDIKKVAAVLESFSGTSILRLIEMSPQTQLLIAKEMQEELQRSGFKTVTVKVVNKAFWVDGTVSSNDEAKVVQDITKAFLPEKIEAISSSSISAAYPPDRNAINFFLTIDQKQQQEDQQKDPIPKLIKISAQFVELRKDYGKVFGFKWAPLMSDDGSKLQIGEKESGDVSSSSTGAFSAIITNLFPRLNSLKSAGYGRIIHSGMVVTKEKVAASVSRNTDIPFQTLGSADFSRPAVAKIGLNMTITPTVLEEENVSMNVDMGVTLGSPSGGGSIITTTNNVKTEIIVKSSETAVIGGVMQNQDITNYDRDDPAPAAATGSNGGAPPRQLFGLLRSRSNTISRNQYVIFITPELIASAAEGTSDIKNKFKKRGR